MPLGVLTDHTVTVTRPTAAGSTDTTSGQPSLGMASLPIYDGACVFTRGPFRIPKTREGDERPEAEARITLEATASTLTLTFDPSQDEFTVDADGVRLTGRVKAVEYHAQHVALFVDLDAGALKL